MKENDSAVSTAIEQACQALAQSPNVAERILAWLEAVASEGLSAEEKAQRVGLIRDEIEPEKTP
jgi:hypothetical protein